MLDLDSGMAPFYFSVLSVVSRLTILCRHVVSQIKCLPVANLQHVLLLFVTNIRREGRKKCFI